MSPKKTALFVFGFILTLVFIFGGGFFGFQKLTEDFVKLKEVQTLTNKTLSEGTTLPEDYYSSLYFNIDKPETVSEKLTLTALPAGEKASQGLIYLNPPSSTFDATLFGIAVGDEEKLRINSEGDIIGRDLTARRIYSEKITTDRINAYFLSGSGKNLTGLNASNISSGTISQERISGECEGITGLGTIAKGTWQGEEIEDEYVSDQITASRYLLLTGGTVTGPLIFQESASAESDLTIAGLLTAKGIIKINPQNEAPSSPSEGILYYNEIDNNLYLYSNGYWVDLTQQGQWTDTGEFLYPNNAGITFQVSNQGDLIVPGTITQTGGQIVFSGNIDAQSGIDITGDSLTVGGAKFIVDPETGEITIEGDIFSTGDIATIDNITATGNIIIGGDLTVTGAQTYSGAASFTADSPNPALSVRQNGIGDIINFKDSGTDIFTIADGGQATLTGNLDATSGIDVTGAATLGDGGATNYFLISNTGDVTLVGSSNTIQKSDGALIINTTGQNLTISTTTSGDLAMTSAGALTLSSSDWAIGATGNLTNIASIVGDAGGMAITGGTGSGDDLTLASTTDATKGDIYFHSTSYYVSSTGDLALGGRFTFENAEYVSNETNGFLLFQGSGGADDTDIIFDLDGSYPIIYSAADSKLGLDDDLEFIGAQTISTSAGDLTLDSFANLVIADTTIQFSSGSSTFDIYSIGGATTLTIENTAGGQVANLKLGDGSLYTGATERLTNLGALANITGYSQTSGGFEIAGAGNITFSTSGTITQSGTGIVSFSGDVGIGEATPTAKLEIAQTDAADTEALIIDTEETAGAQAVISVYSDVGADENLIAKLTAAGNLSIDGALIVGGASTTYGDGLIHTGASGTLSMKIGGVSGTELVGWDGSGNLTLGDSGSTAAIDSSGWAISTTGDITGIGSIASDSAISTTYSGDDSITTAGEISSTRTGAVGLDIDGSTELGSAAGTDTHTIIGGVNITENDGTVDGLKITQIGAGNVLLVEDAASDTTPFVIDADGNVGIGTTAPSYKLDIAGTTNTQNLISHNLVLPGDNILTGYEGFNNYLNVNGGIGTGGISRIDNQGNLVNIARIQAGEMLLTNGGTFATKVDYTTGTSPYSVAIGDVSGDGKADIAVANLDSNTVSVFINNGDGTFAAKVDYITGSLPISVAMGDVSGDGKADLAVVNILSNTVSVFINNGDGTFATKVDYTTGTSPYSVVIGDVSGDGKADLAVANGDLNTVSVFINNGDGTFATKVDYTTGTSPYSVVIGDVSGDGKADLAVANRNSDTVSVFINNGDGTFAAKVDYTTGSKPRSVAMNDVSGDGKADLAVVNIWSSTVSVFINNGDGTFATKVDYTTGTDPVSVAIGDVSGDGKADLAVASYGSNTVSVFINNGDGTFVAKVDYATGTWPYSVAIGDVSGDGKADLAVANYFSDTVSVFINNDSPILFAQASSGNVGIGTATPGAKLEVETTDGDNVIGMIVDQNDVTNNPVALQIENAGAGNALTIDQNGNVGTTPSTDGAILIENTGNTGIGLSVYSNIGATADGSLVYFTADNDAFDQEVLTVRQDGTGNIASFTNTASATSGAFTLTNLGSGNSFLVEDSASADSTPFVIDDEGNVGIGTASPGFKLHVAGNIGPDSAPTISSTSKTATTIDSDNSVGHDTSITIGTDGLPVISHYDDTSDDLRVCKCNDASCTSATCTTVDSDNDVGNYTSIAIGTDGLPVISHYDNTTDDLRVCKCNDASCAGGDETCTTVDSSNNVGYSSSIAIGTDGLPVISHHDLTSYDLRVCKCSDISCTSATCTTIDSTDDVGRSSSIAIGTDGLPVISCLYRVVPSNWGDLRVCKCSDISCTSATCTTVDSANDVGHDTSIAIGTDGLTVISHYDTTTDDLRVCKCNDASCTGGDETCTTVDSSNNVGNYTSIAIGTDGLPVISYLDDTTDDLRVCKCSDISCTSATCTTIDSTNNVGFYTSIAIGTDGLPVISHGDITTGDLRVVKCANTSCSADTGSALTGGYSLGGWQGVPFNTISVLNITNPTTFENLSLLTNNIERLTITPSGNTGIGVTDPDTALEIYEAGTQLKLSFDGTDNATFAVDTNGDLTIVTSGDEIFIDDHLKWTTDNQKDIGASGATRPRTGYFGTSVVIGGTTTIDTNSITGSGALTVSTTGANNLTLTPGTGLTTTGSTFQITGGFLDVDTYAGIAYSGATTALTVTQSGTGAIADFTNTASATSGAFTLTNLGSGNSFLVEDSASADSTPFVIDASGQVGIGTITPLATLDVRGTIENGLVAWWSMDEGTGETEIIDQSINSNTGTLGGGDAAKRPTWTNGKFGKGLDFDGTDDYVSMADHASLNITDAITIEAWFNTSDDSSLMYLLNKLTNEHGYQIYFRTTSPYLRIRVEDSGGTEHDCNVTTKYQDGNWHHLIFTFNGVVMKAYIDGIERGSTDWTGSIGESSTIDLTIGKSSDTFNGAIDEVRIYNRALSAREISESYRQKAPSMAQGGTVSDNSAYTALTVQQSSTGNIVDLQGTGLTSGKAISLTNSETAYTGTAIELDIAQDQVDNAFLYDGAAYTDNTTEANSNAGTAYDLLSLEAVSNDELYFSDSATFDTLNFDIVAAGAGVTLAVKYCSAETAGVCDTWTAVSNKSDGTSNFTQDGKITWTDPGSTAWKTCTIDSVSAKWIQMTSTGTNITTAPTAYYSTISMFTGNFAEMKNAGTTKFVIDSDGNVGIGTTTPLATLDVRGTIENGLVAWWSMDEGTGETTITDQSINSNTGTFGTAPADPTWTNGKFGKGLSFDGTDDYVSMADHASLNITDAITTEVWVYPTDVDTTNQSVVSKYHSYYELDATGYAKRPAFYINGTSLSVAAGDTQYHLNNNNWYHLVGVYDKDGGTNNKKIYVNGELAAQATQSGAVDTTDVILAIGKTGGASLSRYFKGDIDEVKIYNRALSAREISESYRQKAPSMAQGGTISDNSAYTALTVTQSGTGAAAEIGDATQNLTVYSDGRTIINYSNFEDISEGSAQSAFTVRPVGFAAVAYEDAGVYTDRTTEAKSTMGTAFTVAETAAADIFYVGHTEKFYNLTFDLSTISDGDINALDMEFSAGGTTWTDITSETDGTSLLTADGSIQWEDTDVSSWAAEDIDTATAEAGGTLLPYAATDYYWIRMIWDVNASPAVTAYIASLAMGTRMEIYAQSGDTTPTFYINDKGNVSIGTTTISSASSLTVDQIGTGKIVDFKNSGTSAFEVNQAIVKISQPLQVNVAGDVGFSRSVEFTSTGESHIYSEGPFTIAAGDPNSSENLTLTTRTTEESPETGTADAGSTATTIVDAAQTSWVSDEFVGGRVEITAGTNVGEIREICANASELDTTITVSTAFSAAIDATSVYAVYRKAGDILVNISGTNMTSGGFKVLGMDTNAIFRISPEGDVGIGTMSPAYALDIKSRSTVGTAFFVDGGGALPDLDDITTGGTFIGATALDYRVKIDSELGGAGGVDTFTWSDDGGSTWDVAGVDITGSAQTLNNGVTVIFAATTGHDLNDYWNFSTTVTNPFAIQNAAGTRSLYIGNDGNIGIGVTDPDTALEIYEAGTQLKLSFDGTDNATFAVDTNGDLTIATSGDEIFIDDHLKWTTDNQKDIGATGATRPRTGYFGTSVVVGGTTTIDTNSITGSGALTVSTTGANNLTLTPGTGLTTTGSTFQITGGLLDVNTYADIAYSGATTALTVAQSGGGDIVEFKDDATPIFTIADTGTITIAGQISYSGSGKPKRSIILTAAGGTPPTADGAAQTKVDGTHHSYYVLDFDDGTAVGYDNAKDESAYWHWIIPDSYDAGNIDVIIYWFANDVSSDTVDWVVETAGVDAGETYDVDLTATGSVADASLGAGNANKLNSAVISSFSPGWAVEDEVIFRVYRDGDDVGDDTMVGDARLVKVKIEYSVDAESD